MTIHAMSAIAGIDKMLPSGPVAPPLNHPRPEGVLTSH
jgi:hypothetical protein